MIPRLVLFFIFALFFAIFACNLEDGEEVPTSPRIAPPLDTCKPPTCYPDPRPPAPPRL